MRAPGDSGPSNTRGVFQAGRSLRPTRSNGERARAQRSNAAHRSPRKRASVYLRKLLATSIYATQWTLRFPRFGDAHSGCEWVPVIGQGVPNFIGTPTPGAGYESGDPYSGFLPPALPFVAEEDEGEILRAIVIVRHDTEKIGQEYIGPLVVLSGEEYAAMRSS
jgi:hypothetical protein